MKKILASLLLALALTAGLDAAIAYVDVKNGENITGSSVASVATSATMNVVSGNLLVACSMHQQGATLTGITDGGSNAFTSTGTVGTNASAGRSVDIWYKANATANAAATFTASFSPNSQYPTIIVMQFSGVATSSLLDQTASGFADVNSTVTSSSFTPAQANEVAIACAGENTAELSWTPNSGYTGVTASAGTFAQYKITLATSSQTVSAVNGNGQYKAITVGTFKEAAGGGGGSTPRLTLLGVGGHVR